MRALLISCLCLAVAARPKMRPAEYREDATGEGAGDDDNTDDSIHNWETKDPVLRGWANMQVCLDNIRYSQATLTEGTSVAGSFADKLAGRVKGLLDLGAPLHQSFLWNINTLQSTLFRVIWTMSTLGTRRTVIDETTPPAVSLSLTELRRTALIPVSYRSADPPVRCGAARFRRDAWRRGRGRFRRAGRGSRGSIRHRRGRPAASGR